MKKLITICAVITMVIVISGSAFAGTSYYTVAPYDLAGGAQFLNGQGGLPFGYDPDQPRPDDATFASGDGAPGFGNTSFAANVQGSATGGPLFYTSLRLSPKEIFGVADVTVGQLDEISYWTKQQSTSDSRSWQLKIYTESSIKWYGTRINSNTPQYSDTDWHLNSTLTNLSLGSIFDKVANAYLPIASLTLEDALDTYASEKILFIDIIAGYDTDSPSVYSYLDGVTLSINNGADVAVLDLVAVPVPGAFLLGGIGVSLVGWMKRRKSL